jgi:hypothetical protein
LGSCGIFTEGEVIGHAYTSSKDWERPRSAVFYYFLVSVDGRPHDPAVVTTNSADRRIGEVIVLGDGSSVRVRAIEPPADDETAGRGLDGVLVVEPARQA